MRIKLYITMAVVSYATILSGCQTMPSGPNVAVMPAPGKPFDLFQQEDQQCRNFAANSVGPAAQAANDSAVGAAVIGTALGAAVGAIGGRGHGRAVGTGAAVGLAGGSLFGGSYAQDASYSLQRRYDIAYEQCMYSNGNQLPQPQQQRVIYRY